MVERERPAEAAEDAALQRHRERNLRLLLLRATRTVNRRITAELQRRGFPGTRPGHGALLANLDLAGNSVTEIAERAQISKQAMARLAVELEELGVITRRKDAADARALVLAFTPLGRRLVQATVEIVAELEAELEARVGATAAAHLRTALLAVAAAGDA